MYNAEQEEMQEMLNLFRSARDLSVQLSIPLSRVRPMLRELYECYRIMDDIAEANAERKNDAILFFGGQQVSSNEYRHVSDWKYRKRAKEIFDVLHPCIPHEPYVPISDDDLPF